MTAAHDVVAHGAMSQARPRVRPQPLLGRTVVLVGGPNGSGSETARLARAAGGEVTVADAAEPGDVERFLDGLPGPVDHLVVSVGRRTDGLPVEDGPARERRDVEEHLWMPLQVARAAVGRVRPGGTLLFLTGTPSRPRGTGTSLLEALQVARRTLFAGLAAELSPVRVNLIGGCLVDKPLSARLLTWTLVRGDDLRSSLPLARVVCLADVAELAVHLMADPAVTGASYDIDAGRRCRAAGGPVL
jgi:NAD(P)-dependent dehydrogenase (short-subunit alcohol dehydrogenase family)